MASADRQGAPGPSIRTGKISFTPPGEKLECETAYWLWGDLNSNIPPLIVLHGGPAAPGRDWKVLAALHEQHDIPVLLYDQIGCGESTHLRNKKGDVSFWTDELFLAELDNIKRHFDIETFDLLGHSCGGMLAILYALTQPKGLRKLIIASAPASDSLRTEALLRLRAELPAEMQDAIKTCEAEGRLNAAEYKAADAEYSKRHFCRLEPWPAEIQETIAQMEEDDTVSATLYGNAVKPTGPRKEYNVVERLHEVTNTTVPGGVLLTNGRYDMSRDEVMAPFFTRIQARVKWVRFDLSSHSAHVEEPQAYLAALADFLMMT